VYVPSPPETKIVHQPVIQTVEKPIYIEKIVQQPIEVEKIVEKFIDRPVIQTVEKPVYIEKFIDRPVEKIVEKPVIQTIEKFVDRPVEKYIDRPYPVPYAVGVPYEKHVFHKPDFHVFAKSLPQKHKLFDFEGLFGFLGKKKEVKHIFVPSSQQHQQNSDHNIRLFQQKQREIIFVSDYHFIFWFSLQSRSISFNLDQRTERRKHLKRDQLLRSPKFHPKTAK
jgi:hypothetical protein